MLSDLVAASIDEIAIVEYLGIPSSSDNEVIGIAPDYFYRGRYFYSVMLTEQENTAIG